MITEKDISFENNYPDGRKVWQDVLVSGNPEPVAALAHKMGSLLKPTEMWIQKLIQESEIPKVPRHYESEDEGYVFAVWDFDTQFDMFLKYLNE